MMLTPRNQRRAVRPTVTPAKPVASGADLIEARALLDELT
jgi:hypothetical protein